MKGLNLSKFQKIASDKKTTTLQHADGHQLTILHSALPALHRKALEKLPIKLADGTPNGTVGDTKDDQDKKQPPVVVNVGANSQPQTMAAQQPVPATMPVPAPETEAPTQAQIPQPAAAQPYGQQNGLVGNAQDMVTSVQNQQAAAANQVPIDTEVAKAAASQHTGQIAAEQEYQQVNNDITHQMADTTNSFAAEMKDINPTAFTQNMGTGQKVLTAVGLLLGGFGTGVAGGTNPAMEWLDKNIDRDIDAQKANNDKRKTIYGAYLKMYGDANVAAKLAKVSEYDRLAAQFNEKTDELRTAQANVNNQKAQAAIFQAKAAELKTAASLGAVNHFKGAAQKPPSSGNSGASATPINMHPDMKAANATLPPSPNALSVDKGNKPFTAESIKPILKDNVEAMFPQAKAEMEGQGLGENWGKFMTEYNNAYQADVVLKRMPDTFNKLQESANALSTFKDAIPHAVGGLGAAVGALIGKSAKGAELGTVGGELVGNILKPIMNTDAGREYAVQTQNLLGYISSALAGRGDQFIKEAVTNYLPDFRDSPKVRQERMEGLVHYIKDHAGVTGITKKIRNSE